MPERRERGFSLIEVLVAFVICTLALGALLRAFGGDMRAAERSAGYTRAVLLAKSRLASIGVEEDLVPGETSGEYADTPYRWRITASPFEWPTEDRRFGLSPFEVEVEIGWTDGEKDFALTLTTVRLVGPSP
jgi:general secretion pathway protein I